MARPLAAAGVRMALRRPPVPLFVDDETAAIHDRRRPLVERRRRRSPARVVDLGAARARLRPLDGALIRASRV